MVVSLSSIYWGESSLASCNAYAANEAYKKYAPCFVESKLRILV